MLDKICQFRFSNFLILLYMHTNQKTILTFHLNSESDFRFVFSSAHRNIHLFMQKQKKWFYIKMQKIHLKSSETNQV